jgi:hypothetical protein
VIPYADAGKSCTDKADCLGRCIVRTGEDATAPLSSAVAGKCEVENPTFGCFAEVREGKIVTPFVCVD